MEMSFEIFLTVEVFQLWEEVIHVVLQCITDGLVNVSRRS